MRFIWNEAKRQEIWRRRRFDLLHAALIFEGPVLTELDTRFDYGEDRYISIGKVEEEYFVVVHTPAENAYRLITAWRAGRRARREYQKRYPR
jgi:uncharacterized DUF497 family protein